MGIDKKLIRFKTKKNFNSENGIDGHASIPSSGSESDGTAEYGQIKGTSIVFIEDSREIWTHGKLYSGVNWSIIGDFVPTGYTKFMLPDDILFTDANGETLIVKE